MKILFAGPSIFGINRSFFDKAGITLLGPAKLGDIANAVRHGATKIGLIDGLFDNDLAPSHKEIILALSRNIPIAGAASLGALRAVECETYGMLALGTICSLYRSGHYKDDADVAIQHAPAELLYQPVTTAWVDMEPTLESLGRETSLLSYTQHEELLRIGKNIFFKERTYTAVINAALEDKLAREECLSWVRNNQIERKRTDATLLIDWMTATNIPGNSVLGPDYNATLFQQFKN